MKDIEVSKSFYEKLGFEIVGGDAAQKWLILRNGTHTIGLFEGMFPKNMLTFNPGWDQQCDELDSFTDVRELIQLAKEQGLEVENESSEGDSGPGSFMLTDPDGNPILIDQHR